MRPFYLLGVFAAVAMGISAGCASLSRSTEASVSVTNLRPLHASLFETSAELTVRYANETVRPLSLAGSVHRLYLNGSYVGRAVSNEAVTIPGLSTTTQTVTIHLENLSLIRKLRQLPGARVIAYRLDSHLHPAASPETAGRAALKLSSAGELDLSGLNHLAGAGE